MSSKRFLDLLERATAKSSTKRAPATTAELGRLVLPRFRDGSGDAPPPKSLLLLLARDRQFRCWGQPIVPPPKARGPWRLPSTTIGAAIREVMAPFAKVPKTHRLWNDDPRLPALVPLPSGGDQRHFLYVGQPDDDGEYPIVTLDDQPEVFISRASLAQYVVEDLAARLGEKVATATSGAALARARKRNAKTIASERWSDDPAIGHFLETGTLPSTKAAAVKPTKQRGMHRLHALRTLDWWETPYKTAVRALVDDAAAFTEADLLEVIRSEPWPSGNAAAQMIVARAGGKPTAALASLILEIDRRRASDLKPPRYDEGWCRHGFSPELSTALVAIFRTHPSELERIRSSTRSAGVKPAYEAFLAPLVKKAQKAGAVSVPRD